MLGKPLKNAYNEVAMYKDLSLTNTSEVHLNSAYLVNATRYTDLTPEGKRSLYQSKPDGEEYSRPLSYKNTEFYKAL